MKKILIELIFSDEDQCFIATIIGFPDSIQTHGNTMEEVLEMAKESILVYKESLDE